MLLCVSEGEGGEVVGEAAEGDGGLEGGEVRGGEVFGSFCDEVFGEFFEEGGGVGGGSPSEVGFAFDDGGEDGDGFGFFVCGGEELGFLEQEWGLERTAFWVRELGLDEGEDGAVFVGHGDGHGQEDIALGVELAGLFESEGEVFLCVCDVAGGGVCDADAALEFGEAAVVGQRCGERFQLGLHFAGEAVLFSDGEGFVVDGGCGREGPEGGCLCEGCV